MEIEYKIYIVQYKNHKQWAVVRDIFDTVYFSYKDSSDRLHIFNNEVKGLSQWCEDHSLNLTILNKKERI